MHSLILPSHQSYLLSHSLSIAHCHMYISQAWCDLTRNRFVEACLFYEADDLKDSSNTQKIVPVC